MWTREWKRAQELAWLVATEYAALLLEVAQPRDGVVDWLQVWHGQGVVRVWDGSECGGRLSAYEQGGRQLSWVMPAGLHKAEGQNYCEQQPTLSRHIRGAGFLFFHRTIF